LEQCHAALQALYRDQCLRKNVRDQSALLLNDVHYGAIYTTLKRECVGKHSRLEGDDDPQDGTLADTFTPEELYAICKKLIASAKSSAQRDLSQFLFMIGAVARCDDALLLYLCDIMAPTPVRVIGERL
jgi:hypothetical protein